MAIGKVREHLKKWGKDTAIMEFDTVFISTEQAAGVIGCEPARIARTIAFRSGGGAVLVVVAGDAKTDNGKFKKEFGFRPTMLTPQETAELTGHPVGGVGPYGLANHVPVFLDISLKRFDTVVAGCGSLNAAIKVTCPELEQYAASVKWVDVCKNWNE